MVSNLSILFMAVSVTLSVAFPLTLAIYYCKKHTIPFKTVLIGALMFLLFQGILRIPALTYIQTQSWYSNFAVNNMTLTGLIIAFTAGLFETAGRYVGLSQLIKGRLSRETGIAYGIGHGGIEAILLVGITYIANIVLSIMINSGSMSGYSIPQLISTPPDMFLMAGIERVFTILFHIALALLVTYGILKNEKKYVLYCLLIHTLLDSAAVLLQINKVPIWGIEAVVAVGGLLSLIYIVKSKEMFNLISIEENNGGVKDESN